MVRRLALRVFVTLLVLFAIAWAVSFRDPIWYRSHANEHVGSFGLSSGYFFWEWREVRRSTGSEFSSASSPARASRRFPLMESYWLRGVAIRADPIGMVFDVHGDAGWRVALWPGVALCSIYPLLAAFSGYRKLQLLREGACRVCGRDLTGNTCPVCPDCGSERRSRPVSHQNGTLRRLTRYACLLLIAAWAISGFLSVNLGFAGGSIGAELSRGDLQFTRVDTGIRSLTTQCRIGYFGYSFHLLPRYYVPPLIWERGMPPSIRQYHNFVLPLFPLALLSAVVATMMLVVRSQRAACSSCDQCGYNLVGNVSGVCPECGEEIT